MISSRTVDILFTTDKLAFFSLQRHIPYWMKWSMFQYLFTSKTKEIILQDTACGHNGSPNYDKTKMKYVNVYYRTETSLHTLGFSVQHSNCSMFLTFLIISSVFVSVTVWSALAAVIADNSLWRQTFANAKTSFWFQIRFSTEGQDWDKPLLSFPTMVKTHLFVFCQNMFSPHIKMIGNYEQLNDYG